MRRLATPFAIAAIGLLAACGGSGGEASGPGTSPDSAAPQSAGDPGSGSAGVVSSEPVDGSGTPFGAEERDGDGVEFVTTSSTTTTTTSTTTTTLPPTTTSTTTTSTTLPPTTTSTTSTTTTSTTVPPPTTMQCSFAADALFEPGEAVLTDQAISDFGEVVSGITDVRSVRVEGRTDHRGSDAENLALSQARADAAAAALVDAGVDESLITAVGLGEAAAHQDGPSGGPTDEEMAADRRVDVIVDAEVPITTSC